MYLWYMCICVICVSVMYVYLSCMCICVMCVSFMYVYLCPLYTTWCVSIYLYNILYVDIYLYSMMYVLVTQFGVVHKNSTWYNTWVDHVEDFFDDSLFKYERWELTRTLGGWKFKDLFLKRIQMLNVLIT